MDDITFSGSAHIARLNPLIKKIVKQEGFNLNPSKTKVMDNGREQVVTGVRVNQGIDVPSEKIQEVRNLINELEVQQRSGRNISESELASLRGKIQYVTQLNQGAGRSLQRRLGRVLNRK